MEYIFIEGNDEVFVLFHGTGGNEKSLLFLARYLNSNASILSFKGNVGSELNRRYFKPLINNKVDREDLDFRVSEFLKKWDKLEEMKNKKIIFIGYSNGANFILSLLEKRPDISNQTILLHPSNLNWNFEKKPLKNKIVATIGRFDLIAPPNEIIKIQTEFRKINYNNFEVLEFNSGHEITEKELKDIKEYYLNI